eukprot:gene504-biopygen7621
MQRRRRCQEQEHANPPHSVLFCPVLSCPVLSKGKEPARGSPEIFPSRLGALWCRTDVPPCVAAGRFSGFLPDHPPGAWTAVPPGGDDMLLQLGTLGITRLGGGGWLAQLRLDCAATLQAFAWSSLTRCGASSARRGWTRWGLALSIAVDRVWRSEGGGVFTPTITNSPGTCDADEVSVPAGRLPRVGGGAGCAASPALHSHLGKTTADADRTRAARYNSKDRTRTGRGHSRTSLCDGRNDAARARSASTSVSPLPHNTHMVAGEVPPSEGRAGPRAWPGRGGVTAHLHAPGPAGDVQ